MIQLSYYLIKFLSFIQGRKFPWVYLYFSGIVENFVSSSGDVCVFLCLLAVGQLTDEHDRLPFWTYASMIDRHSVFLRSPCVWNELWCFNLCWMHSSEWFYFRKVRSSWDLTQHLSLVDLALLEGQSFAKLLSLLKYQVFFTLCWSPINASTSLPFLKKFPSQPILTVIRLWILINW